MAGYHTTEIPKGKLGEFSKIEEEFFEAKDALEQENPIMVLLELSDMLGAIEEYCKKHVNWRFFNYILNILTEYEDKGHTTIFQVCFIYEPYDKNKLDSKFKPILYYESGEWEYRESPFRMCKDYEEQGLWYVIKIIGKEDAYTRSYEDTQTNSQLLEEIHEKIKNKINLIEKSYKLVFKPKQ